MFEESGPLGKGITVGKIQVALQCRDRNPQTSILGLLESRASSSSGAGSSVSSLQLARLGNEVCLALLRRSDDWVGACSASKWFSQTDQRRAESYFNDAANREASKFEKVRACGGMERSIAIRAITVPVYVRPLGSQCVLWQEYIPGEEEAQSSAATLAVVSLVVEIQGDQTK
jgi:hypothetical protein